VVSALRQRNDLRRQVIEADVHLELVARADGRWEAYVTSSDGPSALWPSVNGPSSTLALDALEAELREMLRGADAVPVAQR
jgi:hypothetical protein